MFQKHMGFGKIKELVASRLGGGGGNRRGDRAGGPKFSPGLGPLRLWVSLLQTK